MIQPTTRIPISSIILDEDIYPRKGIDPKRVGIFAENLRDGFKFEPIEVEPAPDKPGKYRLLDGAHRWSAYKSTGVTEDRGSHKEPRRDRSTALRREKSHRPETVNGRRGKRHSTTRVQ
jgi:hypothetical protein